MEIVIETVTSQDQLWRTTVPFWENAFLGPKDTGQWYFSTDKLIVDKNKINENQFISPNKVAKIFFLSRF